MDNLPPRLWCSCHTHPLGDELDTLTVDGTTHTLGMCLRMRAACGHWSRVGDYVCQRRTGHPGAHAQGIVRWWS